MSTDNGESDEIIKALNDEIKDFSINKDTSVDEINKNYKILLEKYQFLALDYHHQSINNKKSSDQLYKHIEHITSDNQRLIVENTLLNRNNMELTLQLRKCIDSLSTYDTHCLRVRNIRRL